MSQAFPSPSPLVITDFQSNPSIPVQYTKGTCLGQGGFASCFQVTNLLSNQHFAAKIIPKSTLTQTRARNKLLTEISIHQSLHHPYIVDFVKVFDDSENYYVILELCPNQTLRELIRRRRRLTELETQYYTWQIVQAVLYIHSRKVIHRDLALGNMLLSADMQVKIGDFGLAAKVEIPGQRKWSVCGTPNYMAPEMLKADKGHSYEVDNWAVGVVMYTLLYGRMPFETSEIKTTHRRIRRCMYSFPEDIPVSSSAKDLISRLLHPNPDLRLSLPDVHAHPFFHQGYTLPSSLPLKCLIQPPTPLYLLQFSSPDIPSQAPEPFIPDPDSPLHPSSPTTTTPSVSQTEIVYVHQYLDYSSKYGLGYRLNNGDLGVLFNDNSKIVEETQNKAWYVEKREGMKREEAKLVDFNQKSQDLEKKLCILEHFRSCFEVISASFPHYRPVYVRKWWKTSHSTIFRLSNRLIQGDFRDSSRIFLSNTDKSIQYIDKTGEKRRIMVGNLRDKGNKEILERVNYVKEVLRQREMREPECEWMQGGCSNRDGAI